VGPSGGRQPRHRGYHTSIRAISNSSAMLCTTIIQSADQKFERVSSTVDNDRGHRGWVGPPGNRQPRPLGTRYGQVLRYPRHGQVMGHYRLEVGGLGIAGRGEEEGERVKPLLLQQRDCLRVNRRIL